MRTSTILCLFALAIGILTLCICQTSAAKLVTFARTNSSQCTENLETGPFDLDADPALVAFSSLYMNATHTQWFQNFNINNSLAFTIQWDFDDSMTMQERFDTATAQGVNVTWTVTAGSTSFVYRGLWWFSDGLGAAPVVNESRSGFSGDDGMWGAAPGDLQGNGGPCLGSYEYDRWGHGNCDGSDDDCANYFMGNSSGSGDIVNEMKVYADLPFCGDGMLSSVEVCDDNNTIAGDGCNSTCGVETGYECTAASPSVCTPVCGDGMIIGSEACDDNNGANNDGCTGCAVDSGYTCTGQPSVCTRNAEGDESSAMHLRSLFAAIYPLH